MKIISKAESTYVSRPEGSDVNYYLREEYELHYNEQKPHTTQIWHHHEKIFESLYIIEGELLAQWKEDGQLKEQIVRAGDLIETENAPHTFINQADGMVKFIVIKQVLSGESKRELFKNDKILD